MTRKAFIVHAQTRKAPWLELDIELSLAGPRLRSENAEHTVELGGGEVQNGRQRVLTCCTLNLASRDT